MGERARVEAGALVPYDTTRWRPVATTSDTRVFLDAASLDSTSAIVEVWTWHALPAQHEPRHGVPYDRVLKRDHVYCLLDMTAPKQVVMYLGQASVGGFLFPHDTGPFGWAPGSVEESVARCVCPDP